MKENKLIFLLKILTPVQQKALKNYLNLHYAKYQAIQQLLQYLLQQAQQTQLSAEKVSDEKLFQVVWGKATFDKGKISRLRYTTYQLVEDFLIRHIFEEDKYQQLWYILNFYSNYQIDESYEKILDDLQSYQEKIEQKDANYYYHQFIVAESHARYLTQTQQRDTKLTFQNVDVFLNVFFLSKKLEIACAMHTRNAMLNTNFQPELLAESLTYIEEHPEIQQYPSIAVYYHLYKMLRHADEIHYFSACKNAIHTHHKAFSLQEIKNLQGALRNYCILKINTGEKQFEQQLFELYQQQMKEGWLLDEQQQLPAPIYKNVTVLALRLQQHEWAQAFILDYQDFLPETHKRDAFHFCQAKVYFHKQNYPEILKLLNACTFEDVFFDIDARKLLLQMYYEQQEWELLDSSLNSFRVFLHRNKTISESHKNANRNFANFLKKIAYADLSKKGEKAELTKDILHASPLAEKAWLLEKLIEVAM
ncbi:MAG: hypothetical protein ACKVTZ_06415 [Bacteroidia bacterium]